MIDHVLPKEHITAEKTNLIIDKANGLQTPSSRFVNTPNGTLTPPPDYTPGFSFFPVPEHILQTKHGASLQMTLRGQTRNDDKYGTTQKMSWFCYLGPNTATLKSKVCPYEDIDSIWLGSETSSLFKEVTDNMIDSLSAVGNWVDVGAYDEESVKVAIVKISTNEQSQQPLPPKYAAVICGGDLDGFSLLLDSEKYLQYDKAEQVDKHSYTIAALDNNDRVFLLGYGPDPLSSALDYPAVDSQISALQLSSLGEEVHIEVSGELSTETVYRDLFNFGLSGTVNASHLSGTDPGDIEFVMRESKTTQNSGKRVNYLKYSDLSAALQPNGVPVDADVAAAQTSSLQTRDLGNGTKAEEMFNFHLSGTVGISLDNLSAYDIVVRNPNGGSPYVLYGKLSVDIYPDSEGNTSLKSVAWLRDDHELQLYKFNENGTSLPEKAINLSSDGFTPLLPSDYEFVLRKNGAGGEVTYANLSCCIPDLSALSGTSISGDHNVIPGYSNSIDTKKDSRGTYHQLHGFENPSTRNFYLLMDGKYQFVIRDYNSQDKYVVYSDISSFVNNLTISGDANIPASRSVILANENGRKFYKLYNWQGNNHVPLTAEIKADGQIHYIDEVNGVDGPKHLLFENHLTGELEYHGLGIKIPTPELSDVGGGDEIIQNITVISADLSSLSADLSALDNFWVKGEDNLENYGSSIGDSSKTQVINLDTKRLNGTWYIDSGDFNVGGTCLATKLESSTVLQIGSTTINETQLQQLLALIS